MVPYEYQFVLLSNNIIKLASKLNHNCDNLAGATSRETFPPINLQNISVDVSQPNIVLSSLTPRPNLLCWSCKFVHYFYMSLCK